MAGDALVQTAQSVLAQKFEDFEYLIKDGGSTDGSLEALPRDAHIRIIRSPDCGIFDAMNQALEAAKGRYIHFLNAGDLYIDIGVLEDVSVELRRTADVQFFYGDVLMPGANREYICYPERLSRYFVYTQMPCHQGWFVTRELYHKIGKFKLGAKIGSDQVFYYDAILGAGVNYKHIHRFIARYDLNGASSIKSLQKESAGFRAANRNRYFPSWERMLYKSIWKLRTVVRAFFLMPPLFSMFKSYQRLRLRKCKPR